MSRGDSKSGLIHRKHAHSCWEEQPGSVGLLQSAAPHTVQSWGEGRVTPPLPHLGDKIMGWQERGTGQETNREWKSVVPESLLQAEVTGRCQMVHTVHDSLLYMYTWGIEKCDAPQLLSPHCCCLVSSGPAAGCGRHDTKMQSL